MTIKERKFLIGIPLGRERVVSGRKFLQEAVYTSPDYRIEDSIIVDGSNDSVTRQRRTHTDQGFREQSPSKLIGPEINGEGDGVVVNPNKLMKLVFKYSPE